MASDSPASPIVNSKGRTISSLRRCAKCARRCADSEFKNERGDFTPYDSDCRKRFPSLNSPHCVLATKVAKHTARRR